MEVYNKPLNNFGTLQCQHFPLMQHIPEHLESVRYRNLLRYSIADILRRYRFCYPSIPMSNSNPMCCSDTDYHSFLRLHRFRHRYPHPHHHPHHPRHPNKIFRINFRTQKHGSKSAELPQLHLRPRLQHLSHLHRIHPVLEAVGILLTAL